MYAPTGTARSAVGVSEFGQHPGGEDEAQSGKTQEKLGVRVLLKMLDQLGLDRGDLDGEVVDDRDERGDDRAVGIGCPVAGPLPHRGRRRPNRRLPPEMSESGLEGGAQWSSLRAADDAPLARRAAGPRVGPA